MPNRILKESIHTSEDVNRMSDFQFRLWVSLLTYVDDYGRGDARPSIIKGTCFPLRDRITNKDIDAALKALAGIGCVGLYEVDGKPYLYFPTWESHQSIRNKKSRFPAPNAENSQLQSIESNCNQLQSNVPVIQSESESESNPKESAGKPRRFTPPTLEEVQAYCEERKNGIDPQRFLDFYEAKGWKVGNQAMKDWRACVRTWEGRDKAQPKKPQKYTTDAEYDRSPASHEEKIAEFLKSAQKGG